MFRLWIRLVSSDTPGSVQIEAEDSLTKEIELPVMTMEGLDYLETYLQLEDNLRKAQIEMSRIGGNNPSDFIRRVMMRMVDDAVYKNFNWEGKKGKKKMKDLKFVQVILGALSISKGMQDEKEGSNLIKIISKMPPNAVNKKISVPNL